MISPATALLNDSSTWDNANAQHIRLGARPVTISLMVSSPIRHFLVFIPSRMAIGSVEAKPEGLPQDSLLRVLSLGTWR